VKTSTIVAFSVAAVVAAILAVTLLGGEEKETVTPAAPPVAETPEPAKPRAPADAVVPSFDVVRISREGTGVIAGRAAPEAFVEVLADGKSIGRVRANRDGEWVLIFDTPLEPGTRELTLAATIDDESVVESTDVVIVAVPEPSSGGDGDGTDGVVAVLTPRDGNGTSRVLQRPGALQPSVELGVDTLDIDAGGRATFSGFAPANTEVRFYLDNHFVASVTANDLGRWKVSPENPVEPGDHVLRLDQIVEGDDVALRVEQPFNPASALDMALAENSVLIQPGNNLWNIARKVYGHGVLFTQIFQSNQTQIRDPDLIYPGQRFILPAPEAPKNSR